MIESSWESKFIQTIQINDFIGKKSEIGQILASWIVSGIDNCNIEVGENIRALESTTSTRAKEKNNNKLHLLKTTLIESQKVNFIISLYLRCFKITSLNK